MSSSAASNSSPSSSSRAAAIFGAGPMTSQPRSLRMSAVNGASTGESSTSRIRRLLTRIRALVDEPGDDIAVGTRHFHLCSRIEDQEAFAVGVRLDLADEVEVDDCLLYTSDAA